MELRKATHPPAPAADDDIDPGLLDHIPDVETHYVGRRVASTSTVDVAAPELQDLLSALKMEMQSLLDEELTRVGSSVVTLFGDLEGRLAEAHAVIESLSNENAQLVRAKERYEHAFQALRDLARDVEDTP